MKEPFKTSPNTPGRPGQTQPAQAAAASQGPLGSEKRHPFHVEGLHIGGLIAAQLDAYGMTRAEFGRRLYTSRQNINSLLRKTNPPIETIWQASVILQHDFFADISAALREVEPRCLPPMPEPPAASQPYNLELLRMAFGLAHSAISNGMMPQPPPTPTN